MARLFRPVTKMSTSAPAATASSAAYWMSGLSTTGSISLGLALVAGRNRVPKPATGNTALRTGLFAICIISLALKKAAPRGGPGMIQHLPLRYRRSLASGANGHPAAVTFDRCCPDTADIAKFVHARERAEFLAVLHNGVRLGATDPVEYPGKFSRTRGIDVDDIVGTGNERGEDQEQREKQCVKLDHEPPPCG